MKSVLITGASGFIGRQCIHWLKLQNFEVHAVFSRKKPSGFDDINWHQANLLDTDQPDILIRKIAPTHLLHLAWIVTPGICTSSLENLSWLRTSIDLLQSFLNSGGKRVVIAGSCFEYDWNYGYCLENRTPLSPATLYGTCKHALQLTLKNVSELSDLSSAWGRVFYLYGPHEHPDRLVPSVIRSILKGEDALCSPGTQIRDFLHVSDVGKAFVNLLLSDVVGPVNIASGQPIAVKDLIHCIADKLGRRDLVKLGALAPRTKEPHFLIADVSRLHEELNFSPQYDMSSGINNVIDWWKQNL